MKDHSKHYSWRSFALGAFLLFFSCITLILRADTTREKNTKQNNLISLNLENSLLMAINNNIDLKTIHIQKKLYDQSVLESYREFFPTLAFSYIRTEDTVRSEQDTKFHKLSIDSEITIYDGGKRGLTLDIAQLKRVLTTNEYTIILNKIIQEVLEAYLQILQYKDVIEIHKMTLQRGLMQLKFIEKEFKLGSATKFQVLEIEAKVKEIELNVQKAEDDYSLALNKFKLMLKIDWRNIIDVIGSIENDFLLNKLDPSVKVETYVAQAIHNRNEVLSSDIEFDISKKTYRFNSLYYFPKFSIGLNYNLSDDRFTKSQFIPHEKGWGVTFKVSSSLFGNSADATSFYNKSQNNKAENRSNTGGLKVLDNMSYQSSIIASRIDYLKAEEKTKDIRQQVSIEVLSSYSALLNAGKMIEIAEKQLELYDTQLAIERLKANMGESSRYDLIKKEIERGEAAISKLAAKVRYISTISTLELAMGMNIGYLKLYKISHKNK